MHSNKNFIAKRMKIRLIGLAAATIIFSGSLYAGNPQRAGSAGAPELLINPWARSAGWNAVSVAGVKGVEASYLNIAGTAQTERTDVSFTNTQWLLGAGIGINAFGFNQKVGANGVLGATITSFDYGEWDITTTDNPEGGIGTISPSTVSIGASYAQRFTESILGGVNIKMFSQSSQNMSVAALCFDAGVQYITGDEKQVKFGITLRNVGPSPSYSGDGKAVVLPVPDGGYMQTYNERSAEFELPTTLSIGGSYDFNFTNQRFTAAGAFQSNSFEKDQYTLGGEYSLKEVIAVRAGYTFFDNRGDARLNTSVFTGFAAGMSVDAPLGDSKFILDYSYRATSTFSGVHSVGVTFSL